MRPVVRNMSRFNRKDSNGGYCSLVFCVMWSFVVLWILFLGYCWHYGLINDKKIENLVHNVDIVINKTEDSFLRGQYSLTHALHPDRIAAIENAKKQSTDSHELIKEEKIENTADDVYVIFSTDCSPYQNWQSLVLFHSARRVKQKGSVIRIASGCTDEEQKQLTELYEKLYQGSYYAHFTPDFKKDGKTNKKCKKRSLCKLSVC